MYIINIRNAQIGIIGNPFQYNHLTDFSLKGCLHCRASYLISFRYIHPPYNVGSTPLERIKLNGPGLAPYFFGNLLCQIPGGSRKLAVAKSIHIVNIICQFTDVTSVLYLYSF